MLSIDGASGTSSHSSISSFEARLQQIIGRATFRHPRQLSAVLSEVRRVSKTQGLANRFSVECLYADFRCLEVLGQSASLLDELVQATECARSNGWSPELAMLLCAIGRIQYTQGDYREAAAQWGQAIDVSKLCGARATEVEARIGLGQVYDALGDGRTAARLHTDAAVLAEQTQDAYLISKVALNQGFNHRVIGDPAGASRHFQRALQAATHGKVRHYIAESHWQLAALYLDLGDLEQAKLHNTEAMARAQSSGYGWLISGTSRTLADLQRKQGLLQEAAHTYERALQLALLSGARRHQAECHAALSELMEHFGDYPAALRHSRESNTLQGAIVRQLNVAEHLEVLRQYDLSERSPLETLLALSHEPSIQGADKQAGLQLLCTVGRRVLQVHRVAVWERQDSGMGLIAHETGVPKPPFPSSDTPDRSSSSLLLELEHLTEPRVLDDFRLHPHYEALRGHEYPDCAQSSIEVPLRQRGEFKGALVITNSQEHKPWSREGVLFASYLGALASQLLAVHQIQTMADQLSQANTQLERRVVERTAELDQANAALVQANQALNDASQTDTLTGLHNRRYLLQHMDSDMDLAMRDWPASQRGLVLYLVDIDHFKRVNDDLGHDAGDQILVQVAERLRRSTRKSSHVVRWGGEEFLVVTRNAEAVHSHLRAERICQAFREAPFRVNGDQTLQVTCSVGFATCPMPSGEGFLAWNDVLNLADQALHRAKHQGRNGWMGVTPQPGSPVPSASVALGTLIETQAIATLRSPERQKP